MQAIAAEHQLLVENLRTAFDHESNAHLRYVEFAEKADGEGWHRIASLFRAVARAEQLHAANHGRLLHQLGGHAEHTPQAIEVNTTFENVSTALAGEIFEADTMYPAFAEMARAARDVAAVRTFTWALQAEKTHARLFNEALALLEIDDEESWATMAREFYVCPVCGHTSEDICEAQTCPACFCAWSRFETCR
jgi:rubrerythrin